MRLAELSEAGGMTERQAILCSLSPSELEIYYRLYRRDRATDADWCAAQREKRANLSRRELDDLDERVAERERLIEMAKVA